MIISSGRNMNLKIDPYELCPCGSNDKFKFCCYQLARRVKNDGFKPLDYSEARMTHEAKKMWEKSDVKKCLALDENGCKGQIKNAHSIQNNRILNRISKDNHLYYFSTSISKKGPAIELKKISKNKASTFFGFCDHHDTELFKPIELRDYTNDMEQNFLFAFRAHAIEYHRKIRKLNHFREILKINPSQLLYTQGVYLYRVHSMDVADCEKNHLVFKNDFMLKDYSRIRTIYRKLDYEISFATSSSFAVRLDLEGNLMNDIYSVDDEYMPSIYLNVFPVENRTNIIISHHLEDEIKYKKYFDQIELLSNDELVSYLNYLIIEYTENIFFNPTLIERLNELQKESLIRSFSSSINLVEKFELLKQDNYFNFNLFKPNT